MKSKTFGLWNLSLLTAFLLSQCNVPENAAECTRHSDCGTVYDKCKYGSCVFSDIDAGLGAKPDTDSCADKDAGDVDGRDAGERCIQETYELKAVKDASIRADLYLRKNDNYGCDPVLVAARGRIISADYDMEYPEGAPGATQALIQFDTGQITGVVQRATLALTVRYVERKLPFNDIPLAVYRILAPDGEAPWEEGNGSEGIGSPEDCVEPDFAYGVAWTGNGSGMTDKPEISPRIYGETVITKESILSDGDQISIDITPLVNEWVSGDSRNNGMSVLVPERGESFHAAGFCSRERETHTYLDTKENPLPKRKGPRLYVEVCK